MTTDEKATLDAIDEFNLLNKPGDRVKVDRGCGYVDSEIDSPAWYDNKLKRGVVGVKDFGRVNLSTVVALPKIRQTERVSLIRSLLRGYREQQRAYLLTVREVLTAEEYRYFETVIGVEKHG
ncbi:MAG: hypothetical protein ABFD91_04095 [Anaerohalosphaeraceae bacterium]